MTSLATWFAFSPLWQIAIVIFVGMTCAAAIGYRLRSQGARDGGSDSGGEEGFMVSAVMGLLALLVGFTFSLAIDRYDTRRGRVLDDANAIGTAYLQTQLLGAPHRARLSQLLSDFTDNRLAIGNVGPGQRQSALIARNDRLITDLWTATVAAYPSIRQVDFSSTYVGSMNHLIDMDAARKTSRTAHVPPAVLVVLFGYQFIAAGVMGYVLVGRRGRQAAGLLFLLFGTSLLLIIDIDRPTSGLITESQQPMVDLQASIRAQPPAIFDRFNTPELNALPHSQPAIRSGHTQQ